MVNNLKLVLFALFYFISSQGSELNIRKKIRENTASFFLLGEFSKIHEIRDSFFENEARTPSGIWKLAIMYAGISNLTSNNIAHKGRKELEEKALKIIKTNPGLATGYLIYAEMLINHAWSYRKNRCHADVYVKLKNDYQVKINKAKTILTNYKKIASKDPHWYKLMLIIAREDKWGKKEFTFLLNEAIKKHPYYHEIYFSAVDYLLPNPCYHDLEFELEQKLSFKYYSVDKESHEIEIKQFAQNAVKITYEKEQKAMYARIYWYILSKSKKNKPLYNKSTVSWMEMKLSFDDIIKQYQDPWNINNFARFACLAGDSITTKRLIEKLGNNLIVDAWNESDFYQRCKKWSNSDN